MRPKFTVSRTAFDLIMAFEGFRSEATRLPDGRWTIGFGHTRSAREGAKITEADGEVLLTYDLAQVARLVEGHVYAPLVQNQIDALCSFTFNIGEEAFLASPTLRRLNEGRPLDAAAAMELYRRADLDGDRIVIDALVRRRAAEKALFLKPQDGWVEAPTPILPPKLDYDLMSLIPLTSPVAARAATSDDGVFAERGPVLEDPEPVSQDGEAPLATEAAAAAVIERLEALFAEPGGAAPAAEPVAEPAAPEAIAPKPVAIAEPALPAVEPEAPAPEPVPEPSPVEAPAAAAAELDPFALQMGYAPAPEPHPERAAIAHVRMTIAQLTKPRWVGPLGVVLLGALGVALLALAAIWGFQADTSQVLGVAPRTAGLGVGLIGVVLLGLSAYFILERLGRPRDRQ